MNVTLRVILSLTFLLPGYWDFMPTFQHQFFKRFTPNGPKEQFLKKRLPECCTFGYLSSYPLDYLQNLSGTYAELSATIEQHSDSSIC